MSKLPAMPFFVDDYTKDTPHLSLEEHGAYLLLLMAMWRHKGAIPDDDKDNARLLGLQPRAWLRLKPRLMPFFETYAGQITQKRLQRTWNYAVENSARQSAKGKAGAKARYEKNQLLKSIPGYGPGQVPPISPGHNHGYNPSNGTGLASKKERYILPSYSTAAEEEKRGAEKKGGEMPDIPSVLDRRSRLLDTDLMRRTS